MGTCWPTNSTVPTRKTSSSKPSNSSTRKTKASSRSPSSRMSSEPKPTDSTKKNSNNSLNWPSQTKKVSLTTKLFATPSPTVVEMTKTRTKKNKLLLFSTMHFHFDQSQ